MTRDESGGGVISTLTTELRGVEERVGELKAELGAEEDTVFCDGLRSANLGDYYTPARGIRGLCRPRDTFCHPGHHGAPDGCIMPPWGCPRP